MHDARTHGIEMDYETERITYIFFTCVTSM